VTLALSWSGGKDSALALRVLRDRGDEPAALLTTVTDGFDRVSMHGVRRTLLRRQADSVGVPLVEVAIPPACTNEAYEERMGDALASPPLRDVAEIAFGDLFLEDVRAYREERLARIGKRAAFPLWGRNTTELARAFVDRGFEGLVACVDPSRLDASFAGRAYDSAFLDDLPPAVDPCGEHGEFHTFVYAGPVFNRPVPVETGAIAEREGFVFCDLLPG
jgi:uncharacterized protein (TIGR00290 family)